MGTGFFLGGSHCPTGLTISFLASDLHTVRDALVSWRAGLSQRVTETRAPAFPACAKLLDPQETPWTTELLIDCSRWTAYLNNAIGGGDPTAAAPLLSQRLACDCVVATHVPIGVPGHASMQLALLGPAGEPPLMYIRTIAAHAEDGRWSWLETGRPQSFEDVSRYKARRVRDRFDRDMLVSYLRSLEVHVDEPGFYRGAIAIRQRTTKAVRSESVAALKAKYGCRPLNAGRSASRSPARGHQLPARARDTAR